MWNNPGIFSRVQYSHTGGISDRDSHCLGSRRSRREKSSSTFRPHVPIALGLFSHSFWCPYHPLLRVDLTSSRVQNLNKSGAFWRFCEAVVWIHRSRYPANITDLPFLMPLARLQYLSLDFFCCRCRFHDDPKNLLGIDDHCHRHLSLHHSLHVMTHQVCEVEDVSKSLSLLPKIDRTTLWLF